MKLLKSALTTAVFTFAAATAGAQALPNFSGVWEMNAAKTNFGQFPAPSKYVVTIEQTGTMIKSSAVMASPNGDMNTKQDFSLDGKPTTGTGMGGSTTSTTVKLDATGLVANTKVSMAQGEMTQTAKWSLSPDGKQLTIDQGMTSQMGEMKFLIVLDKKP